MHRVFIVICFLLFTVANLSTCYLYLYPLLKGCSFPSPLAQHDAQTPNSYITSQVPPFRLLVLGDPQLEGDSSLLETSNGSFPSLKNVWSDITTGITRDERSDILLTHWRELIYTDLPRLFHSYRKRLDLLGNDYYLGHIYRSLHWSTHPTHVAVLGDLIGSQWVTDDEFERRGTRYWKRVFNGGSRVEDEIADEVRTEIVGHDERWDSRIINVAGNHDIGYAGDITSERLRRFERVFGKVNWETRFSLPFTVEPGREVPELRLVILNSLNLDPPALDSGIQADTYKFMNDIISSSRPVEDKGSSTILLTHLPLYKEAGVCVDGPYFTYYEEQYGAGVKEQNHLSYDASMNILEGIYGMSGNREAPGSGFGRNGIILTGHDHEGCDVYHHLPENEDFASRTWAAESWNTTSSSHHGTIPGIREVTVRSMMGDFGGNAGLLSAWFDPNGKEWKFQYTTCALGSQHIWWAVHVLDIVAIVYLIIVGWMLYLQNGIVGWSLHTDGDKAGSKEKTL